MLEKVSFTDNSSNKIVTDDKPGKKVLPESDANPALGNADSGNDGSATEKKPNGSALSRLRGDAAELPKTPADAGKTPSIRDAIGNGKSGAPTNGMKGLKFAKTGAKGPLLKSALSERSTKILSLNNVGGGAGGRFSFGSKKVSPDTEKAKKINRDQSGKVTTSETKGIDGKKKNAGTSQGSGLESEAHGKMESIANGVIAAPAVAAAAPAVAGAAGGILGGVKIAATQILGFMSRHVGLVILAVIVLVASITIPAAIEHKNLAEGIHKTYDGGSDALTYLTTKYSPERDPGESVNDRFGELDLDTEDARAFINFAYHAKNEYGLYSDIYAYAEANLSDENALSEFKKKWKEASVSTYFTSFEADQQMYYADSMMDTVGTVLHETGANPKDRDIGQLGYADLGALFALSRMFDYSDYLYQLEHGMKIGIYEIKEWNGTYCLYMTVCEDSKKKTYVFPFLEGKIPETPKFTRLDGVLFQGNAIYSGFGIYVPMNLDGRLAKYEAVSREIKLWELVDGEEVKRNVTLDEAAEYMESILLDVRWEEYLHYYESSLPEHEVKKLFRDTSVEDGEFLKSVFKNAKALHPEKAGLFDAIYTDAEKLKSGELKLYDESENAYGYINWKHHSLLLEPTDSFGLKYDQPLRTEFDERVPFHNERGSEKAENYVAFAKTFHQKLDYVWGGASLEKGADCSGFVSQILAHYGYLDQETANKHGYDSRSFKYLGKSVSLAEIRVGDVVCYEGHVAIYIGNGQVIHAPSSKRKCKVEYGDLFMKDIWRICRFDNGPQADTWYVPTAFQ